MIDETEDLCKLHDKVPHHYKILTSLTAGAIAGAIAKTTIAPLERSKINFQVDGGKQYSLRHVGGFLLETVRQDGVLALWRGNTASIIRVMPYVAINFTAHEQWKNFLMSTFSLPTMTSPHAGLSGRHLPLLPRFMAGVLAGLTATTLTYPLDVAKARLVVTDKQRYKGLVDVLYKIYQQEGARALYRGYIPTVLGIMPYAGTTFFTYETLKKAYTDYTGVGNPPHIYKVCFGGVSGFLGQLATYPLDIVRRRMQTSGVTGMSDTYHSVRSTLDYVWRTEGFIHGLYKGISLNWIKGPIASGITFSLFEIIQIKLRRYKLFQTCPPEGE